MTQLTKAQLIEAQEAISKIDVNKYTLYIEGGYEVEADEEKDTILKLLAIILSNEYILIKKEVTEKMRRAGSQSTSPLESDIFNKMLAASDPVITE